MSREYELEYTRTADKDIKNLDGSNRKRLRRAIEMPADSPRPSGCVRFEDAPGFGVISVGDHRLRYRIDDGVLMILVLEAAPRGGFYDDLCFGPPHSGVVPSPPGWC